VVSTFSRFERYEFHLKHAQALSPHSHIFLRRVWLFSFLQMCIPKKGRSTYPRHIPSIVSFLSVCFPSTVSNSTEDCNGHGTHTAAHAPPAAAPPPNGLETVGMGTKGLTARFLSSCLALARDIGPPVAGGCMAGSEGYRVVMTGDTHSHRHFFTPPSPSRWVRAPGLAAGITYGVAKNATLVPVQVIGCDAHAAGRPLRSLTTVGRRFQTDRFKTHC